MAASMWALTTGILSPWAYSFFCPLCSIMVPKIRLLPLTARQKPGTETKTSDEIKGNTFEKSIMNPIETSIYNFENDG